MAELPNIIPGQRLEPTDLPFLGKKRVNYLIGLFNAINNLEVKVVSQVGNNTATPSLQTSAPKAGLSMTARGAILTIPTQVTSNGSNTTQGWFWTRGARNYDPSQTYQEQQLIYVQASGTVAQSGLLDADTMITEKSVPGIWVALQPVAPVSSSGTTSYHVPRLPMPTPDDMDASNNYWAFVGGGGGPVWLP